MADVAPRPVVGGYQHPGAIFIKAVEAQWNAVGPPSNMTPAERADFHARDVGASADDPFVNVKANDEVVTLEMDQRTAAVVAYAARLMLASCETHQREVMMVADSMPVGSYGRKNRDEMIVRQDRIASRLRAFIESHRDAIDVQWHGI